MGKGQNSDKDKSASGKAFGLSVKLGDLVNSEDPLARIAAQPIRARMSYTLALVLREVGKHLDAKRAAHRKLLERYGTPREKDPDTFQIPPEKRAGFQKEFDELLAMPVELAGIGKIRVSALAEDGITLSGTDVFALRWLLKEDVEPLFEAEESGE